MTEPTAPSGLECSPVVPTWTAAIGQLVNSVAISSDGSRVVAGTYFHDYQGGGNPEFGVYAFTSANNTPLHVWPLDTTTEGAYWVAISADGSRAAAGGKIVNASTNAGFIQAYDMTTGATLLNYQLPGSSRVNKVALSADGSVLVACANSGMYYSVLSGGTYTQPALFTINDSPQSVAVSAAGDWIVLGGYNGNVVLFDNRQGTPVQAGTWSTGGPEVRCVSMTADGLWFAASGGAQSTGGGYWLFDTAAFAQKPQPTWTRTSTGAVYFVTLANPVPRQPLVAAVSNVAWPTPDAAGAQATGGGVQVVTTSLTGAPLTVYSFATTEAPNSASLDATGRLLGVADGFGGTGNFYLVDLLTRSCVWTYPTSRMSWPIAVAANGSGVAGGSDDANVYYFPPKLPTQG